MVSERHRGTLLVSILGAAIFAGFVHAADDVANSLDAARALLEQGDYAAAEQEARARLPKIEASLGEDSLGVAEALDLIVEAALRRRAAREDGLVEYAARAVEIKEARLGRRHPDFVDSLLRQAELLGYRSELAAAEQKFREAILLLEEIHGPDHERVADGVYALARMFIRTDNNVAARPLLERVVAIREAALGPDHPSLVHPLTQLGWVLMDDGKAEEARAVFERAVSIADGPDRDDVPSLANALAGYGNFLKRTGDWTGARAVFERAVEVTEADAERQARWLAPSLFNLGAVLVSLGEFDEAGVCIDRAMVLWESLFGASDPYVASCLVQIGWLRMLQGDYVEARPMFERAVAIADRSGWRDKLANALAGYGHLLARMGEPREARAVFERAVRVSEGPPVLKFWLGMSLYNLAEALADAGELAEAERVCRRALDIIEELSFHGFLQEGREILGNILLEQGRVDEATQLYVQVLEEREASLGPEHDEVAGTLVHLAAIHHEKGELSRATELYERALPIFERAFGPGSPVAGSCLAGLAAARFDQDEVGEALNGALRAEEIGRESLRLTARVLAERQALAYASVRPRGLDLALTVLADGPLPRSSRAAEVWDALIRTRAVVLDEMSARRRSIGGTDEVVRLAEHLTARRSRLANLTLRGRGDLPVNQYREILEEARAEKENAERALAEKSAAFRRESAVRAIGLAEVTRALPPDTAVVAYVKYRHRERVERAAQEPRGAGDVDTRPWRRTSRYLAFVLAPGDGSPAVVPLGPAKAVDAGIASWAEQARTRPASVGSAARRALEEYRTAGEALRRAVWDPVARHLGDAGNVLVVPDGPLHLVDLAALPTGSDRYLVETGPRVHLLSTERDVVRAPATGPGADTLLALGDPDFDARPVPPTPEVLELARLRPEVVGDLRGLDLYRGAQPGCEKMSAMRFGPLPASRLEVDSIASLWTGEHGEDEASSSSPALTLTGPAAHETLVKRMAPHHAVLHLATHGFFVEGDCEPAFAPAEATDVAKAVGAPSPGRRREVVVENPLLRAGLALAAANNRADAGAAEDDGILTAEEVASLDLSEVDWAVLSACRTAVGEIATGEGVLGLRRAFEIAGADTLIMSLWSVDDEATRAWMRELYLARLSGRSTAGSVAQASRTVIRERREAGLSVHPFYWGAFVAAGDWR